MIEELQEAMAWADVPAMAQALARPASGDPLEAGWRAVAELRLANHHGRSVDGVAQDTLAVARALGDPLLETHALLATVGTGAFDDQAEALLERADAQVEASGCADEVVQVTMVRAAVLHRRTRDPAVARDQLLEAWARVDPDSPTALRLATFMANLEGMLGDHDQAWLWSQRALRPGAPWKPGAHLGRAYLTAAFVARTRGDETALDRYLTLAGAQPLGSLEACNLWSLIYARRPGPEAVEALSRYAVPGARYWAHLLYARVLFEEGRVDEAVVACDALEEWSPSIAAFREVLHAGAGRPMPIWRLHEALPRLTAVHEATKMMARAEAVARDPRRALALRRLRWAHGLGDPLELLPRMPSDTVILGSMVLSASPLGEGAQGTIFAGHHIRGPRAVAVKVLKEADGGSLEREAELLRRLDHPNIVAVLEVGRVDAFAATCAPGRLREGAPYFAMRRVRGGSLLEVLGRSGGGAGELSVDRVVREVLEALAHAHAHGVLHLDVKPSNVLMEGGRALLSDFGVTSFLQGELSEGRVAGTPEYMAPEQWSSRRARLGPWTDVYGAACLAWWLLVGERPFRARGVEALRDAHRQGPRPRLPSALRDSRLQAWFDRALHPDPWWRFASAHEALAAFPGLQGASVADHEEDPTVFSTAIAATVLLDEGHEAPPVVGGPAQGSVPARWPERIDADAEGGRLRHPWRVPLAAWTGVRDALWRALHRAAVAGELRWVSLRPAADVGWEVLADRLVFAAGSVGVETVRLPGANRGASQTLQALWQQVRTRVGVGTSSPASIVAARAPHLRGLLPRLEAVAAGEGSVDDAMALGLLVRALWGQRAGLLVAREAAGHEALIDRLAEAVGAPLLVVVDTPHAEASQRLALPAWSREAQRTWADRLLPLEPRVRRRLVARAAGDPDSLWRWLHAHVTSGDLEPGGDARWRLSPGVPLDDPPRPALQDRVGALALTDPEALHRAHVAWLVGRPVDDPELLRVLGATGRDPWSGLDGSDLLDAEGRPREAVGPMLGALTSVEEGEPWVDWALDAAPSPAERGRLLRRLGRAREAAETLLAAARAAYVRADLDEVQELLDEVAEAYQAAEEAVFPAWYWMLRGAGARRIGRYEKARAHLLRAESPETLPFVRLERAATARNEGDLDRAERLAREGLADPASPPPVRDALWVHLGEVARRRGDRRGARAALEAGARGASVAAGLARVTLLALEGREGPDADWFARAEAQLRAAEGRERHELAVLVCWAHAIFGVPAEAGRWREAVDEGRRPLVDLWLLMREGDTDAVRRWLESPSMAIVQRRGWLPQLQLWIEADGTDEAFELALEGVRTVGRAYREAWLFEWVAARVPPERRAVIAALIEDLGVPTLSGADAVRDDAG